MATPESTFISGKDSSDRTEVHSIGGIDCHYALIKNKDAANSEQQDRAAVYALPKATPEQFREFMDYTFLDMAKRLSDKAFEYQSGRPSREFGGSSCVTMAMLDPRSGKMALASKGDSPVYMVLQHKQYPERTMIKRISSRYVKQYREINGQLKQSINHIRSAAPVMWAQADDWQKRHVPFLVTPDGDPHHSNDVPPYALLDLKTLANDIVSEKGKGVADDYKISLLMASDGIFQGKDEEGRLSRIASVLHYPDIKNKAQHSLTIARDEGSADNLSAIVLHDIQIGKGEPVAFCVCDGNYRGAISEGSIAADLACSAFEDQMMNIRNFGKPSLNKGGKGV